MEFGFSSEVCYVIRRMCKDLVRVEPPEIAETHLLSVFRFFCSGGDSTRG